MFTTVRLAPGVAVILRGPTSIQFGADATRSGIVETPHAAELVALLREAREPTSVDDLVARACSECAMPEHEAASIIADLVAYRVLVDSPEHCALVIGRSALSSAVKPLLRGAHIEVRSPLPGESSERFLAAADETAPLLVVDQPLSASHLAHLTRRRVGAVVPATLVDARVIIGPIGPCLHCAHLYHVDRDANWPHVQRVLRESPTTPDPLVVAAGAAAAARVMRRLCAVPDPPGVSAPPLLRGTRIVVDPFAPATESVEVLRSHPRCPACF
ncbi:hypothetical protein [Corynebacterium sp. LK2510]|uniref:hypothetical protein n=1 Tax=Corynebacterium sp. LK2510 TaxID=3110472 RepID=UPI0034CDED1A